MYYVYFLQNKEGHIYFGCTNDLKRRLKEHNNNRCYSTKGSSWRLIYYEAYLSEKDARVRESRLKQHAQALAQLKRRIINSLHKVILSRS